MPMVAVLMGSKSDFPVVRPAVTALKRMGVEAEVHVISAHRTPEEAHAFAASAKDNGIEVIICAAGKAAHLGGVIAAYTTLPVIGLPVKTDMMGGLDSLLSIVHHRRRQRRRKRRPSGRADPRHKVSLGGGVARPLQGGHARKDKCRRRRFKG